MIHIKNAAADLRAKYQRFFEISLVISLAFLIAAFKFFPHLKPTEKIIQKTPEQVKVEDIIQTKLERRPPPPPRPAISIAAPNADILKDVNIGSTEINWNAKIGAPPPPVNRETTKEPHYFRVVEKMPTPIGGIEGIMSKIIYPEIAIRSDIQGSVIILAFVDKHGNVTYAKIVKGIGAGCDEQALKAVEETKFNPGKQRGKPVNVQVVVPVFFKLNN
jgi:periplasmic protein TonB